MVRVYLTTTVPVVESILQEGFTDLHEFAGLSGVYMADCKLNANDGWPGEMTLCLDVPEDVFQRYEIVEELLGYRYAIIPATLLNRIGRSQIYDHEYAGTSRRDLLRACQRWRRSGSPAASAKAAEMCAAMAVFDRIGWLTPLKQHEIEQP